MPQENHQPYQHVEQLMDMLLIDVQQGQGERIALKMFKRFGREVMLWTDEQAQCDRLLLVAEYMSIHVQEWFRAQPEVIKVHYQETRWIRRPYEDEDLRDYECDCVNQ